MGRKSTADATGKKLAAAELEALEEEQGADEECQEDEVEKRDTHWVDCNRSESNRLDGLVLRAFANNSVVRSHALCTQTWVLSRALWL